MQMFRRCVLALAVLTLTYFGFSRPAFAQNDYDPPDRVARLNYIHGNISFLPADGDPNDWSSAVPNRPLTTGDRLWADRDGRAELHIGSTALRIDRSTGISFLNLTDNSIQLQLSAGSLIVRVRRIDSNDSLEVQTPNLAFDIRRPGLYRIDVSEDGSRTIITVRDGFGVVTGGRRSYDVRADQQAVFTGDDRLDYDLLDADRQPLSDFDRWCADRDRREDRIRSTRYVSPELTGYEDLDDYGDWDTPREYGPIWFPRNVPAGWSPYRFGHWVWIFPWQWTWVDDMPWGFAPSHYGRWVVYRNRWGWIPGPLVARPSYSPAMVAWVGGGPGFNFSISFGTGGGIAWFPLGPREVFVPSYRVSDRYVTRVNVTNTVVQSVTVVNIYHNVNVTNITYVNQRAPGGVTAVSHETFVNARPVGRNVVRVPQNEIERAPVMRGRPAEPERNSRRGAGQGNAPRPPEQIMNRPVVTERGQPRVNRPVPPGEGQLPPGGGGGAGVPPPQQQQQIPPPQTPPGRGNERPPERGNQRPPERQVPPQQPPPPPPQQQIPPPQEKRPPQRPPEQAPPERIVPPPPQQQPPPQRQPERQAPPQQPPPQQPPRGGAGGAGGGGQQPPPQQPPAQVAPQQLPSPRQPQQPPPVQPAPPPVPVRQAPPVQPPSQQERANEEAKRQAWEKAHPRPNQPPPPKPDDKKKDDKDKDKGRGRGGSGPGTLDR